VIAGSITGNDKGSGLIVPTVEATVTAGSSSDAWGTSPTPAQLRATDFGCVMSFKTGLAAVTRYGTKSRGFFAQAWWQKINQA
jgi:hypothetical protein